MITFIDLYNDITGQAWSMFDGEIEAKDEFEVNVTTSIQKALSMLWNSYKFPFRYKTQVLKTRAGKNEYSSPNGVITTKVLKGDKVYCVKYNNTFLTYDTSCEIEEDKGGEPTSFYIKNDNIVLFPTPDDVYTIKLDYLSFYPACDSEGTEKATLQEEDDYLNISEKYEVLFKNTLMPLAMTYLIASEQDENYSAYWQQYKLALANLLEATQVIDYSKSIGWR